MGSTLSLCMIVKNEAEIISRCLASVESACDEIVIVDTGSTDQTIELVKKFPKAKVYHFTWIEDFAAARNESFKHATGDLILWLDADDVIKPKDLRVLKELKEKPIEALADAYLCPYQYAHDQFDNVVLSLPRERIFKRSRNPLWHHRIHEYVDINSLKYERLEFEVHHYRKASHGVQNKGRNLRILKECVEDPNVNCPRYEYYYATELYNVSEFDQAEKYFLQYLEHWNYYEDAYQANVKLAEIKFAQGKVDDAMRFCFDSLKLDQQKPEVYCLLGLIYINKNHFELARFWYEAALNVNVPKDSVGAVLTQQQNFTPHFQLCFIYDKLGNREKALHHVNEALRIRPTDETCLHNKAYLEGTGEEEEEVHNELEPEPETSKASLGVYIPFVYDENNPNIRIRKLNIQKELCNQGYRSKVVQHFHELYDFDYILTHSLFSKAELESLKANGKVLAYDLAEGVFDDFMKQTLKEYNVVFCSSSKLTEFAKTLNPNAVHLPDSFDP